VQAPALFWAYHRGVNGPPIRIRALQTAVAIEVLWAAFVFYEVCYGPTGSTPWDSQVQFFAAWWAAPAIAIVVIVWLIDVVAREARR
jgi:hypothetical protein